MAQRRARTGLEPLLNFLIFVVVAAIVGVAGLLVYSRVNEAIPDEPMVGPGTFEDAQGQFRFNLGDGWEVKYDGQNTLFQPDDSELPAFRLTMRTSEEMILVGNYNCVTLPIERVAEIFKPAEEASVFTRIPCARDPGTAFYGELFYSYLDGTDRLALYVFGPLGGGRWVLAYTDPFEGEWPPELVETMNSVVITSR